MGVVTPIVRVDQNTIDANATQHTMAITQGIRTILTAKKIVLMAKRNKQHILDQIFAGRKTPASACWCKCWGRRHPEQLHLPRYRGFYFPNPDRVKEYWDGLWLVPDALPIVLSNVWEC